MDQHIQFCPNDLCSSRVWTIQRQPDSPAVWLIARGPNDQPWTVAADAPICPQCGTTLLTTEEFEGGIGESLVIEEGPLFDFARSIPWDAPARGRTR